MTRTARLYLTPAHDPEAAAVAEAPLGLVATGDAAATGDATGLQNRLHPAAGPPLAADPALTLAATDHLPAVAVTTIVDMAVAADPRHATTEPGLVPTADHLCQTGTRVAGATGPAPSLPAV